MIINNEVYPLFISEFDIFAFNTSAKIFGVISAILIFCLIYSWRIQFQTIGNLTQSGISLHSLMMQSGFDFAFALLLVQTANLTKNIQSLFSFLFLVLISVCFIFDIRYLVIIWRIQIGPLLANNTEHARAQFFMFFIQFLVFLIFYVYGVPFISIPFLYAAYSFWIPQIYAAAVHASSRPVLPLYAIIQTIVKIFPLIYFGIYGGNYLGINCKQVAYNVTGYLLFQLFVVLMQIESGGDFFLPEFLRAKKYDYYSPAIDDGTVCVICMNEINEGQVGLTTPCGHSFHEICLFRWAKEKMECPTCRTALPPLMEPSLSLQFFDPD